MGADRPKQYLDLEGRPILCHTVQAVSDLLGPADSVIVVVPPADCSAVSQMIADHCTVAQELRVVPGGVSRADSVQNGLQKVPEHAHTVAIHDGVRPFVTASLWSRLMAARMRGDASVIPALHPVESVRIVESDSCTTVPRDTVYLVQTPQLFAPRLLMEAYWRYMLDPHEGLTDDAGIVTEYMHIVPTVVEGIDTNIKITTPRDLALARWIVSSESSDPQA